MFEAMKVIIDLQYAQYEDFIRQIPRLIDEGEGTIVYDGRNRVVRMEHEGLTMMVKCFKRVFPQVEGRTCLSFCR